MRERWPSWDDLISRYGLRLTAQGGQLRGPCPLHGGTNPSAFVVNVDRGFFCHACGQGGGPGTFVRLMEGDPRAGRGATRLQDGFGRGANSPDHFDLERLSRDRTQALSRLPEVSAIRPLDPHHPYLAARGVSPETAAHFGAGFFGGPGALEERIVFPARIPSGKLIGHIGRATREGDEPRYRCQKGLPKGLLLLHEEAVSGEDTVLVVEGPFDAMAVHAAGCSNVVALIGCQASRFQMAALAAFRRVVVLLDGDAAGHEGALVLGRALGAKAEILSIEGDPAEMPRAALAEALAGVTGLTDRVTAGRCR